MGHHEQVAVITGAAQGIGRAIAERFLQGGFRLALLDVRTEGFDEWAGMLGDEVLIIQCDIARMEEVKRARDQIMARFGRIDALVNNAGIGHPRIPLEEVTEASWRSVVDVNLTGTFLCTQVFGACMRERGGAIINISSMSGVVPSPGRGAYSASKAAVLMLTQQTALEWGKYKIRANAICPGSIESGLGLQSPQSPEAREARMNLVPYGRLGTAQDVAEAAYFLASPAAEYISGEFVRVDGGFALTTMMQLTRV